MSALCPNAGEELLDSKPPQRIALFTTGRQYTYGDLSRGANAVTAYLHEVGAAKGDRVLLASDNSFFWVVAYLGTLRAGCICVPLPVTISAGDLEYIRTTTQARVAIAEAGFAATSGRLQDCPLLTDADIPPTPAARSRRCLEEVLSGSGASSAGPADAGGDDLAALMFTSGSTGRPRGVMVSHANILANTSSIIQYLDLTGEDRMMTVLPFHYCFGASLLHTHLKAGGSLVIEPRFMYPEVFLQRMIDTECTGFAGVPSHFQLLLRRSRLREKKFPHLRHVQQAGGPLPPAFVRELCQALPTTRIFVMYGQTEATARLSYLPPEALGTKLGSIGKGIPGVRLSVLNDAGRPVQPGEVGEIVAEGDNVTHGYWNAPAETAATFRGRKLYTGDLATVDADGFIYIAGRSKDILKCGGQRVSCRQLEEQVLGFDGLLEAAVVAMPDEILGDAVKLFAVPRDHDTPELEEHLRLFCREHLPLQLVPKQIVILRALPKNSAGKVLKEALKSHPGAALSPSDGATRVPAV